MNDDAKGPDCFGGEDGLHSPAAAKLLAESALKVHPEGSALNPDVLEHEKASKAIEALRVQERAGFGVGRTGGATIAVSLDGLRHLLAENERMTRQVTELFEAASETRNNSLYRRVRAFHIKFGHPVRHTPTVPTDDEVRFRMSLILEEFRELFEACLDGSKLMTLKQSWECIRDAINGAYPYQRAEVRVLFEDFYDALLDLAYVIEGTHSVAGTMAEPGIAEVQRANMDKDPVYVAEKDATHARPDPRAKPRKPEGWTPPNIRAVLIAQGWTPPREAP